MTWDKRVEIINLTKSDGIDITFDEEVPQPLHYEINEEQ